MIYHEDFCSYCREKESILTDVTYWFKAVLDQIYGMEDFDEAEFERYLDELAHVLHIKLPKQKLKLTSKVCATVPTLKFEFLNEWMKANNQYLKSLASNQVGV